MKLDESCSQEDRHKAPASSPLCPCPYRIRNGILKSDCMFHKGRGRIEEMEDAGTRFIASEPTTGMPTSASAPGSKPAFTTPVNTPARIPTPARAPAALVICAYGWGKEVRLYADYLVVANCITKDLTLTG